MQSNPTKAQIVASLNLVSSKKYNYFVCVWKGSHCSVQPTTKPITDIWRDVLERLSLELSQPSMQMWILPLRPVQVNPSQVQLACPNGFSQNWIKRHYKSILEDAFQSALAVDTPLQLEIIVDETLPVPEVPATVETQQVATVPAAKINTSINPAPTGFSRTDSLNPRYQFENFVVGEHNRFAHAACVAVAQSPGQTYNPLFLYGGVGLGKTHLMQAVGHYIAQNQSSSLKIRYATTEQFTNELIQAIATKQMKQFRERYRKNDVLILDDIQFLEGKDRTQEELFHTFNALHESGKQVILSSDRSPEKLSRLEERLRSRFACGLIADIQAPDFETRVAILKNKAQQLKMSLDDSIFSYVADSFPDNVRELEGALNKLSAYKMISGADVRLESAQQLLGRRFDIQRLTQEDILKAVARYYSLQPEDLKGTNRSKAVSQIRQVAIYVLRDLAELSFPQIGHLLGGRKHTTILYAYEKLKTDVQKNSVLNQQLKEILSLIKQSCSR